MKNIHRILIVDDTPSNIKILHDLLKDSYRISVATNGADALELVAKEAPDLILLDIMMPEMDGYEVCRRLKADEAVKDIPVIFVTGKSEVEDESRGFELGAVDYITKPISPPIVLARVKTQLALRDANLELQAMLEKTLGGSIKVLTDILALANPVAFNRANRLKRFMRAAVEHLGLADVWQYEMAAVLSQIGSITLPSTALEKIYAGQEISEEEEKLFAEHPQLGQEMLAHIPRLETVAAAIGSQQEPTEQNLDIEHLKENNQEALGTEVLKGVLAFDHLLNLGDSRDEALIKMRSRELAATSLIDVFEKSIEVEGQVAPRSVMASGLNKMMIIDEDIANDGGVLLIKKGSEVTLPVMKVLQRYAELERIKEPIRVLAPVL